MKDRRTYWEEVIFQPINETVSKLCFIVREQEDFEIVSEICAEYRLILEHAWSYYAGLNHCMITVDFGFTTKQLLYQLNA